MKIETIKNIEDPTLSIFKMQRDSVLRQRQEVLLDSAKVVERYIKAGHQIKQLLAYEDYFQEKSELLESLYDCQFFVASPEVLKELVGHSVHSGVIALGSRPKDLPLEDLGPKIVLLNGVNNSENIGAITRNALAFGAKSILACPRACSPFVRRAIRVSMGSIFKCKVHHSKDICSSIKQLKSMGYSIFGASLDKSSAEIKSVQFPEKSVLVIGEEGHGIEEKVHLELDQSTYIQMEEGIDSLNAAVASGIFLHQMSSRT